MMHPLSMLSHNPHTPHTLTHTPSHAHSHQTRTHAHLCQVRDASNAAVSCQVNPVWTEEGGIATSVFEVVFVAELGPLSLTSYQLQRGGEGGITAVVQFINRPRAVRWAVWEKCTLIGLGIWCPEFQRLHSGL